MRFGAVIPKDTRVGLFTPTESPIAGHRMKQNLSTWGSFSKRAEINSFDNLPLKIKALRFLLLS